MHDNAVVRWSGFLVVLCCLCAVGCYDRTLDRRDLVELFTDSTVEGSHKMDGYSFTRKFHADGRFAQWLGQNPAIDATGTWSVSMSSLCISWDSPHPKAGRSYCREVKTDDKGHYWKELPRGYKVEYSTIVDPDGKGRFIIPSPSTRRWRWMGTWRGWLVYLSSFVLFIILWRKLRAGKRDSQSLRNRISRRLFGLQIGDKKYSLANYRKLDQAAKLELLWTAVCASEPLNRDFVLYDLLQVKFGIAGHETLLAFFAFLRKYPDKPVQEILSAAVDLLTDYKAVLRGAGEEVRFAYLMGQANLTAALLYQTSDSGKFNGYKLLALAYLEHARTEAKAPPPELAARNPYRESATPSAEVPDYAVFINSAYEAITYAQYVPPVKKSSNYSSSSYSGGG